MCVKDEEFNVLFSSITSLGQPGTNENWCQRKGEGRVG